MPHHILAIMTKNQVYTVDGVVQYCLAQEAPPEAWHELAQTMSEKVAEDPAKPDLTLVMSGGHGDMDVRGRPIQLNGQHLMEIQSRLSVFKKTGIRFRNIVLTSCCSASFIPEFQDLLTEDGVLFCQLLSSTSGVSSLLNLAMQHHGDVFSANFATLSEKRKALNLLADSTGDAVSSPFVCDAVYTQFNRTLYHLRTENLPEALKMHNALVGARPGNGDSPAELSALKTYLQTKGVKTLDRHLKLADMELTIRILRSKPKFVIDPLKLIDPPCPDQLSDDLQRILAIDQAIFPEERKFTEADLRNYCGEGYSYVVRDPNLPTQICGYIFAKLDAVRQSIFVGNLGVDPVYQGLGIGRSLLTKVIEKADQEHLEIKLQVRPNNQTAVKLYESLGFEETSSTDEWIQMRRPATPSPQCQILVPPIVRISAKHKQRISASFLLAVMGGLSAGAGLIVLACVLLPPVGLIAMSAVLAYAFAGSSGAAGLGLIGFFGYHAVKECGDVRRQDSSPIRARSRVTLN